MMGPVVAMVWEGDNAVKTGRVMLGATNPADSQPGTIRGDLCIDVGRNICHDSDSVEAANHEIALWFSPEELNNYTHHSEKFVYEKVLEEEAAPALPAAAAAADFVAYEGEYSEFITYSDDKALGVAFPDTSSLEIVEKGHHDEPMNLGNGTGALIVFFAKYMKYEAFPAVEAASEWASKYGLQGVGILEDHKKKDVARFVEKKSCKCDLTLYWDNGWALKNLFQDLCGGVLTMPQLMIVDGAGKIVWRQALSGMTGAMTLGASQFDLQLAAFAAGNPLGSHGASGQEEDEGNYDDIEAADVFETQEVQDGAW